MVRIVESTIIDAPCEEVWRLLRDFNGHDRWHPAIAQSSIEEQRPFDMVGAVRRFSLADERTLREQLLALSDKDHTLTYCLLESPLPLMGYIATIRLRPVTDGDRTFWEWRSEFTPPAHRRDELTKLVRDGIYRAGFAAIARHFGTSAARPMPAPAKPAPQPVTFAGETRTEAVVVDRYGGPEVLRFTDIALPSPRTGEVQIRHNFIGVNYIDVYCRTGYFDLLTPPGVPGMEAAGVIEAVGPGVSHLAVGDRVGYACPPVGAYSLRRTMPADFLVKLAPDMPDEIAAASLLKGITASFLLHDVHALKSGTTVLIHAAAGGVGQLLVQWARHLGATVIATTSSAEKARLVESLGAHHVILYGATDFAAEVMTITRGQGVAAVFDAVGADTFAGSIAALAPTGQLISYGQASGPVGNWDIGRLSSKSITVSRPNYGHYTDTPEKIATHWQRFVTAMRQGALRITPPRRYRLAFAADAHRDLEARRTTGALVLVP